MHHLFVWFLFCFVLCFFKSCWTLLPYIHTRYNYSGPCVLRNDSHGFGRIKNQSTHSVHNNMMKINCSKFYSNPFISFIWKDIKNYNFKFGLKNSNIKGEYLPQNGGISLKISTQIDYSILNTFPLCHNLAKM